MSAILRRPAAVLPNPGPPSEQRAEGPVNVLIIDDSLTVRTVFSRMIAREADLQVVAGAGTAEQGLRELAATPVDVVLLDLEMPGMGGLEALPRILAASPSTKVLVISSLTAAGAEHTVTALKMGAADTMLKPRPGGFDDAYRDQLLSKIRALKGDVRRAVAPPPRPARTKAAGKAPEILAIGASTGGIHALHLFLARIPASFQLPILITQHLPPSFIPVFARQMEVAARREAVLAIDGTVISRGKLFIAPGHGHMTVRKAEGRRVVALTYVPVKSGCMPSVDPMFASLASAYDGRVAAVLLSGMGRDGTDGARAIDEAGGRIYAQDAESCAVWGMPRAVTEQGIAAAIAPPATLADAVVASIEPRP